MPSRRCLDCGRLYDRALTGTWRCPDDQAAADAAARARLSRLPRKAKPSRQARGYGAVYERRRDRLVAAAVANREPCYLCGRPCLPGQLITAHHVDGRPGQADQATCRLAPAHKACNERHGSPVRLLTPPATPLTNLSSR